MLRERCHQRSKDSVVAECHVSFSCEIPSRRRSPTFILMPMFCKIVKSRPVWYQFMDIRGKKGSIRPESSKSQTEKKETIMGACGNCIASVCI
ncbi:hypothetical protein RB195_022995 [Necator americanus]|uniref:Uncharacterized protein n=1 Tax=Necator americanus TaxID=51031 RepID=A0ABR1EHG1_NECAM